MGENYQTNQKFVPLIDPVLIETNKLDEFISDNFDMQLEINSVDPSNKLNFFHFGCWGLDGCAANKPFSKIISSLMTRSDISLGLVVGDNVYENNGVYDKKILYGGVECLKKLRVPILASVGNHDVINCQILKDQIDLTQIKLSNGSMIVDLERSNWIMPHNYYNVVYHLKNFSVNFINLDTNLFSAPNANTDCYQDIDRQNKLTKMLEWLTTVLKLNKSKCIILCGHYCLFGLIDVKLVTLLNVGLLLDVLNTHRINSAYTNNYYYMCADIHNFQYIRFVGKGKYNGLIIHNIIAGIGGGVPDSITPILPGIVDTYIDDQTIKPYETNKSNELGQIELIDKGTPYGYLVHKIDENGVLMTEFVMI